MIRLDVAQQSQFQFQPHNLIPKRIHSCRWAWCRLTFPINAELVHHVIHDHVRRATPVMRKDIPMLKRAEEGLGESMSGFATSCTDNSIQNHGDQLSDRQKSKHACADVEPSSSLPSPPASSPLQHSPKYFDEEASEGPAPTPDRDVSQSPSPDMQQQPCPGMLSRPDTPNTSYFLPVQSPGDRNCTPTFASLSSPADSPGFLPVPSSPSFDSLVYEATTGKRKQEDGPFSFGQSLDFQWHNLQENSLSSSGSQDVAEKQLMQSMDVNDDDDGVQRSQRRTQITQSHAKESGNYSVTPILAQTDEISYKGELHWAAESSQMAESNLQSSQMTSSLAPLQTHQHSSSMASMGVLTTPTRAIHTPMVSVQKQAWYGTLLSHPRKKRKSCQNSSFSATDLHQSTATADILSQKPAVQIPSPQGSRDLNSRSSVQPATPRPSGNVFQSGKLHITPTLLESMQPEYGGSTADDAESQARSLMGWSQTQTQTNWLGHASYPPLQTQAPYQSQSASSSQ